MCGQINLLLALSVKISDLAQELWYQYCLIKWLHCVKCVHGAHNCILCYVPVTPLVGPSVSDLGLDFRLIRFPLYMAVVSVAEEAIPRFDSG